MTHQQGGSSVAKEQQLEKCTEVVVELFNCTCYNLERVNN